MCYLRVFLHIDARDKTLSQTFCFIIGYPRKRSLNNVLCKGEDRWLCTRILLAGGRIEFEGGSDCDTFAPEDLATFYKQRRRWGPSTTANIYELIDKESCHHLYLAFYSVISNY